MSSSSLNRIGSALLRRISRQTVLSNRTSSHVRPIAARTAGLPDDVQPTLDLEFLTDARNYDEIDFNIKNRKGVGCIRTFTDLWTKHQDPLVPAEDKPALWKELVAQGLKLPNRSDPRLAVYAEAFKVVEEHGAKPDWPFPRKPFHEIANNLNLLRIDNLGTITGQRTYYFTKELAELEDSLVKYTLDVLKRKGFARFSVPDILSPRVIESCGFETRGDRTQVKALAPLISQTSFMFDFDPRCTGLIPNLAITAWLAPPRCRWLLFMRVTRCRTNDYQSKCAPLAGAFERKPVTLPRREAFTGNLLH